MIKETLATLPHLLRIDLFRIAGEPVEINARLKRTPAAQTIRIVRRLSSINRLAHKPVALVVMHRRYGAIDRNLVKVWTTESQQLRIEVRKQTPLQQWKIGRASCRERVESTGVGV